ncbi:MAG: hypothetical protein IKJ26_00945, partial [Clostridia bacterium]|nr:hypothetical protein [Clostridia bacterium]
MEKQQINRHAPMAHRPRHRKAKSVSRSILCFSATKKPLSGLFSFHHTEDLNAQRAFAGGFGHDADGIAAV